uniref:Uncharacterized protein n=1 Tax=Caenorhabditis japonica TaxID=281687 RepID=A0A8R1DFT5_CAEJA
MQKFVDKFKKKKRSKSSASAMPSKELSRERAIEHNVKEKRDSRSPSKNSGGGKPAKPVVDLTEVTAKAYRKEKEKKSSREKRSAKKRGRKEEESSANEAVKIAPSKTPSCNMIGPAPSQIDSTHNQKVEKGVQKWVEAFAKIDFKKVLDQDFKPIIAMDPDLAKCTVFDKNREWCQSDNLELLDANRVKLDDTDFFYHGSIVRLLISPQKSLWLNCRCATSRNAWRHFG